MHRTWFKVFYLMEEKPSFIPASSPAHGTTDVTGQTDALLTDRQTLFETVHAAARTSPKIHWLDSDVSNQSPGEPPDHERFRNWFQLWPLPATAAERTSPQLCQQPLPRADFYKFEIQSVKPLEILQSSSSPLFLAFSLSRKRNVNNK